MEHLRLMGRNRRLRITLLSRVNRVKVPRTPPGVDTLGARFRSLGKWEVAARRAAGPGFAGEDGCKGIRRLNRLEGMAEEVALRFPRPPVKVRHCLGLWGERRESLQQAIQSLAPLGLR